MIGALVGKVIEQTGDVLILDVGGVGYEVVVCGSVLAMISSNETALRLVVFTDVRENSLTLYGFSSSLEKRVFLLLRKVKGIGSKIALNILTSLGAERLLQAIGSGEKERLRKVPGVGSKTAERLVVELREAVGDFVKERVVTSVSENNSSLLKVDTVESDVTLALERLGFSADRARDVVQAAIQQYAGRGVSSKVDSGELLRQALANISSS